MQRTLLRLDEDRRQGRAADALIAQLAVRSRACGAMRERVSQVCTNGIYEACQCAIYNGAPLNGALYIMVHHLMVRYAVSIRHFLTLYIVNKILFDTI